MAEANLHCELREKTGKQQAKALRNNGKVPAIFYAHEQDSIPIALNEKELSSLLHREVNIINVIFPDKKEKKSILREVQRDPVTGHVVHIDLMGIKLTEKIRLSIPIVLKGTPIGVKEGGILEHILREVEVEGLPLEIPEHIEVDVSELKIGDVVRLEKITIDKVRFVTDIHHAVANVIHPKVVTPEVVAEDMAVEEGEGAKEGQGATGDAAAKEE